MLEVTSQKVTDTVSHSVAKTKDVSREIGGEVSALAAVAQQVNKDMQGVLDTLDTSKDSLRGASDAAAHKVKEASEAFLAQVSVASDKMRQSLGEFADTSEKIASGVRGSGEAFRQQLQGLGKSADEAVARVEVVLKTLRKHSESLVEASNGITEQTGKAGQNFARQVDQLLATSHKALDASKQLDEASDKSNTSKFLEHTGYVVEQLHGVAVDIAKLFQPAIEEELWKRYHKGDQAVFLRHITKTLSRQKFEAIQKKYQVDEKFRGYVMRYLRDYSALIKHARATDRAEVLTTTFSTSDMGKLYMILSKAMENAAVEPAE